MSTKILVMGLPSGTTAEELGQHFAELGMESAQVVQIDGEGDNLTATVELDIDRHTAQAMADRGSGTNTMFKGKQIEYYVPRLMK
jgi:hypothetical protein